MVVLELCMLLQAVLTEYLIRYTDIIFSEKMPIFPSPVLGEETPKKTRPKSLAISTPTKLLSLEEARSRALTSNLPGEQQKFIDVGGGEENLPIKYHTVIELPVRRRSMGKGKKSPSGWRSFFSRGWHTTSGRRKSRRSRTEGQSERPKIGSPIFSEHSPLILQDKAVTESDVFHTDAKKLRSVKSAESLFPISSNLSEQITDYEFTPVDEITTSPPESVDFDIAKEITPSSFAKSTYQKHMRSTSHDSYFERLIDFQMDDELDLDEDSLLEMKPLQKPTSAVNQIRSSAAEEDICHAQSAKDSLGRNKTAHKQKLVSFDSEASSPKLQKLSLKRLYHTLSSPPMVKKKDFSKKEKNNENSEKQPLVQSELMIVDDNLALEKCRALKQGDSKVEFQKNEESDIAEQTSFSEQTTVPLRESLTCVSKLEQETELSALYKKDSVPVEIHREYQDLDMSHVNEEENFEKLDQQSMTVSEFQNASIHDDADDNAISFSVEATRSDSVSLSLLSFDNDQVLSVGNSASKDKQLEHSVGLQNGSVTPESPTGDNVSEIPSSADSEAGDSASELGKEVAIGSVVNEIQNNHLFNNASCLCESDEKDDKITKQDENAEEKLANETELLQITNNVNITYKQKEGTAAIFSPVPSEIGISQDTDRHLALDSNFVENIILSPPENFVDKSPTATVQKQNGNLASKLVNDIKTSAKSPGPRSLERSMTEVHEICPKFVSGIAVSGSLGHELFRANSEFVDSSLQKKRSCSDKLSPISPIEESRRKFESEIGRLIVRDRQMKLEMEQIKAERQRYKTEKSFPEVDKSRLKSEKKFVDALDFRKSPVKSFDSDRKKMDQDDVLKSLRETADDKKTSEMAFTHGYSRYIRMENKPSVKELLSKFESHKKQSDMCERTDSVASPKQSQSVFSNVQVINHNIPLTSSKSLSSNFADSNQSCKDNQISHTKEHIFQTECVVRFPHPKASFLTQDWNKNGSINSDTYDSFGSRSWTSGQCDHRTKVNNSRTAFLSSDNLMTSSVQSNSYGSFSTSPFEGSSPQSLTTEQNNKSKSVESNWLSEQLYSEKSHQADPTGGSKMHQKYSESDENSFFSFQQTYTRPGSITSKMRTEFLQQGISQPLCENGRSVLAPEKFNACDGSHYSRSSFESRKKNSTSRQRPKSVPPPVCRLSFVSSTPYPPAQLTQTISVSKQAETSPNNVPKTSSVNLSNGQESSDTSQTCGPSKRIRDRAAIFERSLSFSGYADKKPYSSSKHSQKAQANSYAR
ncbi:uncharacterized protein LOC118199649 [Stegodyphus dumicola]|uniref:uncharacterized protein LOC118199649 n=1 Tax=Stegodyphus dumicola TaxID=202533 RepID=UPI0015AD6228|nr:uncharacterized protein LOC118199649 [Stegodyphus dumicola]XP_035227436.1 uncharacterized protein LOC118199649 [Stegodyphus dumicola]